MRIGGGAASIVRICTVEVWVRRKPAIGQIKCVLLVARRMIGRSVQRVEAMPFRLDVGAFGKRESHPAENTDRAIEHLRERMKRAEFMRAFPGAKCRCSQARLILFAARKFSRAFQSPRSLRCGPRSAVFRRLAFPLC